MSNASLLDFKRRWGAVESDLPIWYFPAAAAVNGTGPKMPRSEALSKSLSARVPVGVFQAMSKVAYRLMI